MFREGERVFWTNATGIPSGTGRIRGISTTELPVMGHGYIVELDKHIDGHEYSCVIIFQCHLQRSH